MTAQKRGCVERSGGGADCVEKAFGRGIEYIPQRAFGGLRRFGRGFHALFHGDAVVGGLSNPRT
ncbi:hypothetical protein P9228_05495 [Mesorhizobium sp. WSM4898]|uniref:hypothetical protein n=1 Tax=Mesorhizobium sp. WSM4898 TaxID=3038544 RepID=UPI0024157E58|nr:hypothetical protein [Mesorhizobium sp. WSM4898]MDG4905902.1 hypothetical protein [Mesorhizobium sp. WSM4898]